MFLTGVSAVVFFSVSHFVWAQSSEYPVPPSVAPLAPTGITGSRPTPTTATLSWNAVDYVWLSGYRVYRCSDFQGCTPSTLVGTLDPATTTFTDTGLSPALYYMYAVTAFSPFESGESEKSLSQGIAPSRLPYSNPDVATLVEDWLKTGTGIVSDVNEDGVVDPRDLAIMMDYWTPGT